MMLVDDRRCSSIRASGSRRCLPATCRTADPTIDRGTFVRLKYTGDAITVVAAALPAIPHRRASAIRNAAGCRRHCVSG